MREKLFSGYGAVIKNYRTKAELSQAELAERLSVTRNTVINWESEKSQPDMFYMRLLCDKLLIPVHELLNIPCKTDYTFYEKRLINAYRELTPLGQKAIYRQLIALRDTENDERDAAIKEKCIHFSRQQTGLAAGSGIPFNSLPPKLQIMYRTHANEKADTIALVSGHSMEPYYQDGDLVYIRYTDGCDPGDIVACSTADGGVIKRVNSERKLVSLNPDYPYGDKTEDDHVTVIGRVLGVVREEDYPTAEELSLYEELCRSEIRQFKRENGIVD